ncbi:hypothetical protein AD006_21000 [Pseudonocardia sp. EC080610-09]|uniref:hypothetical protein n=1 Tax=unclassified Pseudonocardia TaxID=2619320 RepID=UPI0006CB290F|nr:MULTISPECIES: hypothetical protein [unclassified Pseudonocardia]ALE73781.1 hypothetical protein FRP1_13320 [Pseudonocardia sp. EC080625-04]ALL77172.1 hypothetical protein AD006_21000 [Pseudonocardia sp. EC080610-09]ALL80086.1 hypothetical protein AD017_00580 [Pseudonocardia sp. EC080619-01]
MVDGPAVVAGEQQRGQVRRDRTRRRRDGAAVAAAAVLGRVVTQSISTTSWCTAEPAVATGRPSA